MHYINNGLLEFELATSCIPRQIGCRERVPIPDMHRMERLEL